MSADDTSDEGKVTELFSSSNLSQLQNEDSLSDSGEDDITSTSENSDDSSIPEKLLYMSNKSVRKLESKFEKFSAHYSRISTARSPAVMVSLQSAIEARIKAIIDEGAEMTCISRKLADRLKIRYRRTRSSATSAGSSKLQLAGETLESVTVKRKC